MDNDRPFARVRLYHASESQKYNQRPGSGIHVYVPPTFAQSPKGSRLIIVEGEFKSLALAEAGYTALGLCGFTGAARTLTGTDGERNQALNEELVDLLKMHQPAQVVFLGDSDVVLNAQFAVESAKLRQLLFAWKQFQFIERFTVAKLPLDGAKGADDLRAEKCAAFADCFEAILSNGYDVPAKASSTEIFVTLLKRELDRVRAAIKSADEHEAHRNHVRLLQSAGRLLHETGAMLLLRPLLRDVLDIKDGELSRMLRDVGKPAIEDTHIPATPEKGRVTLRNVEPWDKPVDGDELLSEITAFYERFCWLPACASHVLAVWSLQTWCYELFDFVAIVAVWSPEHECGKGRVLGVAEKLVRRPFRTSNTSAAVLYHVISKGNLTVLVDELDSVNDDQRAAICNILKGGYQSNGTAHRMTERNGEQVAVEFSTYCPKMIATITLDKLDKATRSRTIGVRMQRKRRSLKLTKFRRVDSTGLQRKCLKWAQDNAEAIKAVPPMDVNECATDRQEDVWEPLVALARVAGGDWETRIRHAAQHMAGSRSDGASETVSHQLLAAFQKYFNEHGEKSATKTFIACMNDVGDFADVNYGRGLTPHYVAKLLKPYGIEPRPLDMPDDKTARGYSRNDFEQAFQTYLNDTDAKTSIAERNSVTKPGNIGENLLFENVTQATGYVSENSVSTNEIKGGYGVTVSKPDTAEMLL
ncbi:MAG: DUF3631 domain-containing protein [Verrucomicrobia bacterium]|nr:DUF3631 domain-containing protein [Verrucomicrobiota bacterium]